MKIKIASLVLVIIFLSNCRTNQKNETHNESIKQEIVSSDVSNFWNAFDAVHSTDDTLLQLNYVKSHFVEKASVGQIKMMEARGYTPEEYLNSIKTRSNFWKSIRKTTEEIELYNIELRKGVEKLQHVYPSMTPSTIYFTIGNHRSPGTGLEDMVLIGTEFALGTNKTLVDELPEHNQGYYEINPIDYLQFLTIHEYVHTQQKEMVHNLLSLTLYEGIAEFSAILATGKSSPWKSFTYGPANEEKIRKRFEEDMFRPNSINNWLWNSPNNEFQTRDMSYYVGYQIASIFYEQQEDKTAALKTLIELDYNNESEVEAIVNSTHYFSETLQSLEDAYEATRPKVVSINQFENGDQEVNPNLKTITLNFSKPMDPNNRGFDFGPLGEEAVLRVKNVIGFSEDNLSFTFEVELTSNKRYQSLITNRFYSADDVPLIPFLIDIKTK